MVESSAATFLAVRGLWGNRSDRICPVNARMVSRSGGNVREDCAESRSAMEWKEFMMEERKKYKQKSTPLRKRRESITHLSLYARPRGRVQVQRQQERRMDICKDSDLFLIRVKTEH